MGSEWDKGFLLMLGGVGCVVHTPFGDPVLRALRSGLYESGGHDGHASESGAEGGGAGGEVSAGLRAGDG